MAAEALWSETKACPSSACLSMTTASPPTTSLTATDPAAVRRGSSKGTGFRSAAALRRRGAATCTIITLCTGITPPTSKCISLPGQGTAATSSPTPSSSIINPTAPETTIFSAGARALTPASRATALAEYESVFQHSISAATPGPALWDPALQEKLSSILERTNRLTDVGVAAVSPPQEFPVMAQFVLLPS